MATLVAPPASDEALSGWPVEVTSALARQREAFAGVAAGRVLDLGEGSGLTALVEGELGQDERRYNTVISVASMVRVADLVSGLRAVHGVIEPGGRLLFAEPTGMPGIGELLLASVPARSRAVRALHLNRDVVGAMRAAGFDVVAVDRVVVPTPGERAVFGGARSVRRLAIGVAERRAQSWKGALSRAGAGPGPTNMDEEVS